MKTSVLYSATLDRQVTKLQNSDTGVGFERDSVIGCICHRWLSLSETFSSIQYKYY
jgi:hypothetical protein